ncbi:hypothetical protein [Marinifilum flexuosum]|uniref:hypothetical protein n=1 Tax=Marinifilum flexuosum TaxID=1117708 RepID=UPI00249269A0|nr:hypothetical protein [Marinifilum flexuosum]
MTIETEKFEQENKQYYNELFAVLNSYYKKYNTLNTSRKTYFLWLYSLSISGKDDKISFKEALNDRNFKRFVLELNDFGLEEYLRDHLSIEMYHRWVKTEFICDDLER